MSIISIPKKLREKLGEEESVELIKMLNEQQDDTKNSVIETAELRFEKKLTEEASEIRIDLAETEKRFDRRLTEEISGVRQDLAETEKRFDRRLTEEISGVRQDMYKHHSNTVKWMFIFWIGQIGVLLGVLLTFFK
jgi:predicted outer membrane protein